MAAAHKCPHCSRRVKRALYQPDGSGHAPGGSLSRRLMLARGLARAEELGPDRVILRFAHPRAQLAATRRARWIVEVVFCGQRCAARGGEKCRERAQSVATRAGMR